MRIDTTKIRELRQIMEDKVAAYQREGYPELLARQAAAQ